MVLFDRNFVYPCDDVGAYVELTGEIIEVGKPLGGDCCVVVKTEHGVFSGFYWAEYAPQTGYTAKIRIYNVGGGFYPDNKIIEWSALDIKEKHGNDN